MTKKQVTLVILDGFGLAPNKEGNAILHAHMPNFEKIIPLSHTTALTAFGAEVGLTWGNMGNSEVGHLGIGTGRVILQSFPRINAAIEDNSFFTNKIWQENCGQVEVKQKSISIAGLISDGGVHGDWQHLVAATRAVRNLTKAPIWLHLFADGRDTPPDDLERLVALLKKAVSNYDANVATVSGRYFAMDRDKRWDRVEKVYQAIVSAKGRQAKTLDEAMAMARKAKETDEFIMPTVIEGWEGLVEGDLMVLTNFRPDRARQIAESIIDPKFKGFQQSLDPKKISMITVTDYGVTPQKNLAVIFPKEAVVNTLAETVAKSGKTQTHIAETEKYAHVTYFLNGGEEIQFKNEDRVLVPSPKVATYDKAPIMSAKEIIKEYFKAIKKNYDLIVVNFANADMVGHSGNFKATVQAIEAVDQAIGAIIGQAELNKRTVVITADHGNAEIMIHPGTGKPHKEHTANPVPFILYDPNKLKQGEAVKEPMVELMSISPVGILADVAPTVLDLLDIKTPSEMSGFSLLETIGYPK